MIGPHSKRARRILVLAFVVLVGVLGSGFFWGVSGKREVAQMTEKMKTVCVGRFLMDLPSAAQVSRSMTYLQGFHIATLTESEAVFTARVTGREAQINAATNQFGRKNMESVTKVQENGFAGKIFIFGRNSSYTMENDQRRVWEEVAIEGYVHADGTSFNFIAEGYAPTLAGNLSKLIARLRLVREGVIPTRPGFCFGRGIFLDPLKAEDGEGGTLFASLPGHPDLAIAFSTNAGQKGGPGLLERNARSEAREPFWVRAAFTTLRQGKRTINGLSGEELAVKVTEANFSTVYGFEWEMLGRENDVLAPVVHLEMSTGRNPHPGGKPVQSSLGQAAIVDLWDKVASSIRLRPLAPAQADGPAAPASAAIGAYASAGELCPERGWWQCGEGGNGVGILGGQRQYLKKGDRMPQALLLPPQTLWQRVKRIQPSYESDTPTAWQLVDKRSRSRSTPPVPLAQATMVARADATTPTPGALAEPVARVGSYIKTGVPCPASGWWRCEESHALDGTRWFAEGSLLPAATFGLPPGTFGRAMGGPSVIQRRSIWQLVRYAQAPAATKMEDSPDGNLSPSAV